MSKDNYTKEERKEYNRLYRIKHAKRLKAYAKAHPRKYTEGDYEYMKRWRKKNLKHYREYQAAYQRKYIKAWRERYFAEHPEKEQEYREKARALSYNYWVNNKEKCLKAHKAWRKRKKAELAQA